ncbi:alpha-N-acetylglucosaminidase-like [Andrographis paniculata]|uniref:alpha-N-acetylglucosaminidase-like n=1 Tax=Andrographis paniculata TaxID=175694 RepID=UPI0021E926F2|nr:alpha-N-acetylglucosaminidase-like [Andrographis paniculata]XP_051133049.1 alpha-N-acetylglucosaminidase-like [Andrographis paniculata]
MMALSIFLVLIVFFGINNMSMVDSSTLGVEYVSRLLEIQDRERAPSSLQLSAAYAALGRNFPSHTTSFQFRIISKDHCGGESCFKLSNHPAMHLAGSPKILISGTTGVELLSGLHWYLKYWCGAHISWNKTGGMQLSSVPNPGSLPRINSVGVTMTRPTPWSYYQNAVTSSYAFAWWNWERWEQEIDWMALQGINLPLAFTGQEAIWQKVYQKFNISALDLEDFFGGPAFLAWSRMGNLHGWGGPLQQSWMNQQLSLQKKILARMYELGMNPVLPAFSGNVPAALKSIYPTAKITHLGNWFTVGSDPRWCCTYLLDATDPLFIEIGRAFILQQLKEYGRTSHIYNCDTFDENTPPTDDPEYISSLAAAIFRGMESSDSNAVWLMQGWLFTDDPFWKPSQMKALLHSVPVGKMVVLDLYAEVSPVWETSEQFYGVPYIWCMLHNFAGNIEMYGIIDSVGSGPIDARLSPNSTMVGVGMSMEAIEQNPIVYDLMSEMAFRQDKVDVKNWIDVYAYRRYGKPVPSMRRAWNILYHTLYNCTDGLYDKNRDAIVYFPDVHPNSILTSSLLSLPIKHHQTAIYQQQTSDSYSQPHLWYSTEEVNHALELFITSGDELSESNTYRYDLVDLTRQALAKYANRLFLDIIEAYQQDDLQAVRQLSKKFQSLVEDLDALLACHDGFLLGPWLESAKQLAQNEQEKKQFEWNARTQITMWFDNTEDEASLLRDYGNKYWSGLVGDYYGPRAAIYLKHLIHSLETGNSFQLMEWRKEWIKLTTKWQSSNNIFPTKSTGDPLEVSKQLYNKYLRNDPELEAESEYE